MTGRSHPPTLLKLAERLVRDQRLFGRGDVVLCACSGGPDSTALLHVLARLRPRLHHDVVAHGVDHGLREGAAAELDVARATAERLGVRFETTRVEIHRGASLQQRARTARHEALAHAARAAGARVIATGHTADDRAETFLLRLLRGSGPNGLAVMPPRAPGVVAGQPDLVRPLLAARRADVLAHLARHGLTFADDPTNADPRFARVRVRRDLLPLMETLSPTIVGHLSALADMLADVRRSDHSAALGLGRAQRLAIARAQSLGRRSVDLRLAGGRDVTVVLSPEGKPVIAPSNRPTRPSATPSAGVGVGVAPDDALGHPPDDAP